MTKLLVIEDDKDVRENLVLILESENYTVTSAPNGRLGITMANEVVPDLIVCDIMMPDMDGYEVLRNLSCMPLTKKIPFIFLTAKVDRDDIRKGMELGADDYLFKPFKSSELLKAIEIRLKKSIESRPTPLSDKDNETLEKNDSIFIELGTRAHFIKVSEIKIISAENQYSRLYLANGKNILMKRSLNLWEKKLDINDFIRIHRSTIVNLDYVRKVEKQFNGSFKIFVENYPESLSISRRYATRLRHHF
jgi:DNA-binding LytR/AlgR family response regulator